MAPSSQSFVLFLIELQKRLKSCLVGKILSIDLVHSSPAQAGNVAGLAADARRRHDDLFSLIQGML
jgi:hypothetical protein